MLEVGKNYRITSDKGLNIILSKRRHVNAKFDIPSYDTWDVQGFFATPKDALKFMVDGEIKGTGMEDFKAISKKQDELYDLIKSLKVS